MSLYNTLTDKEKKIFDAGGNSALDNLKTTVEIVSENNPSCTSLGIKDFYKIVDKIKEKY